MDIKSILTTVFSYLRNNPLRFRVENTEKLENALEKVGEKIEEVSTAVKESKPDEISVALKGVSVITLKGDSPSKEELLGLIKPLIPEPEKPSDDELVSLIKPLIPKPIEGKPGKDYVLTAKDKKEIAKTIKVPVVEKIVETVIEKQPIVTNEIKEVAVADKAEVLKEKLESLEGDERLDAKAIKNLPKPVFGGGGGIKRIDAATDTRIINPANGEVLKYNSSRQVWENSTGGGGSGVVETIVAGNNIDVDATDPANPVVSVETLTLADISDVTASTAEINVLDGIPATLTATELGYVDGVTSAIQTQINAKAADADVVHDTGDETIAGVKTFSSDPIIPDEAYGAGWNGSLEVPTKNAVYDKLELFAAGTGIDHSGLTGLGDDDHTQYAFLAGRAAGQVLYGGTAANEDLTIEGTSHATKTTSYVILQPTSGNVGIGTTSPGYTLDVQGIARVRPGSDTGNGVILMYSSASNSLFEMKNSSGTVKNFLHTNGDSYFNGGDVGIGTSTPSGRLEVAQDITAYPTTGAYGQLELTGATTPAMRLSMGVRTDTERAFIQAVKSAAAYKDLLLNPLGGNVGIGTTAPQGKLHLSSTDTYLYLSDTDASVGGKNFAIRSSAGRLGFFSADDAFMVTERMNVRASGGISIGSTYTSADAGANNLIIEGKVGIGTTSPTAVLHLKAGTATANTAPLKLTSGTLNTTPEAGAVEFLTDKFYGTITTGAARQTFATLESAAQTFSNDVMVPDEAYGAGWNGSLEVPTKNAVYDKIEALSVGSGITRTVVVTSGSITLGATASTDYVYFVAGAHTLSMPSPNTNRYTIKNNHSANITVDTAGAELIEGAASISIAPQEAVDILSDGTNWLII